MVVFEYETKIMALSKVTHECRVETGLHPRANQTSYVVDWRASTPPTCTDNIHRLAVPLFYSTTLYQVGRSRGRVFRAYMTSEQRIRIRFGMWLPDLWVVLVEYDRCIRGACRLHHQCETSINVSSDYTSGKTAPFMKYLSKCLEHVKKMPLQRILQRTVSFSWEEKLIGVGNLRKRREVEIGQWTLEMMRNESLRQKDGRFMFTERNECRKNEHLRQPTYESALSSFVSGTAVLTHSSGQWNDQKFVYTAESSASQIAHRHSGHRRSMANCGSTPGYRQAESASQWHRTAVVERLESVQNLRREVATD